MKGHATCRPKDESWALPETDCDWLMGAKVKWKWVPDNWSCDEEAPPSESSCSGSCMYEQIATLGRAETRITWISWRLTASEGRLFQQHRLHSRRLCRRCCWSIGSPRTQSKVSAAILNCVLWGAGSHGGRREEQRDDRRRWVSFVVGGWNDHCRCTVEHCVAVVNSV